MAKAPRLDNNRLSDRLPDFEGIHLEAFESGGDEHHNEQWLISYADMMTLLFGLFVVMYSIAMETQGRPDKVFEDMMSNHLSSLSPVAAEANLKKNEFAKDPAEMKPLLLEKQKLQRRVEQLEGDLELAKNQIAAEAKTVQDNPALQEKIQALSNELASNNFMMIVINWATPQHDIDLRVTDPMGRVFDFQNRTFKESRASFVADSRIGPGLEIWKTPQVESGDYKMEITFYNAYSNPEPAVISSSIITRKGVFDLPVQQLVLPQQKTKSFRIRLSASGEVGLQPL